MEKSSIETLNPGSFNDYVQESGHLPLDRSIIVGFYNDALRAYNNARQMQNLNSSDNYSLNEEVQVQHPGQGTLFNYHEDLSN